MTADIQLYREDTGEMAVVRVVDGHTVRQLADIDQWFGATIDRAILGVKRRFYSDLDRIIIECLDGARLPKQPPTAEDLLARRQDPARTQEWAVFAELPEREWKPGDPLPLPDLPDEAYPPDAEPLPDPVQAYFDADDPDERPGRAVVPVRAEPLLGPPDPPAPPGDGIPVLAEAYHQAVYARTRAGIERLSEGWTPNPDNYGPHPQQAGRYRGPRSRIGRWADGWLERPGKWWRARKAATDKRMGVAE